MTGNPEFSESSKLSLWPFLNNFTNTNEISLIFLVAIKVCHCVKHCSFSHSIWHEKKWPGLNCVSPVLMQNLDIRNFYSLHALNNGKLVGYSKSLWYAIVSNMTHFHILLGMRKNARF